MVKFACVYCFEDNTLTVIGEKSKVLELLGTFEKREDVRLKWGKNVYNGCIVKIGENEEDMTKFATKAYAKILKKLTEKQNVVPEELFTFDHNSKTSGKRQHVQTEKLKESMEQEAEFSPRKKKTSKQQTKRDDGNHTKKKAQKQKKMAETNTQMLTNNEILDMDCISNDFADQFDCAESMERDTSPIPAGNAPRTDTPLQVVQSSGSLKNDDSSRKIGNSKDDSDNFNKAQLASCNNPNTVLPLSNVRQTIRDRPLSSETTCLSTEDISFNAEPTRDENSYPSSNLKSGGYLWNSRHSTTESHPLPLHGHTGTSLTDTWALCTEQTHQYHEDIPVAVVELFTLMIREDVQVYIREFLQHRMANQRYPEHGNSYSSNQGFDQTGFLTQSPLHSTPKKQNYSSQIFAPPQPPTTHRSSQEDTYVTYTNLTNIHSQASTAYTDEASDMETYTLFQEQSNNDTTLNSSHGINIHNKPPAFSNTEHTQTATHHIEQLIPRRSPRKHAATTNQQQFNKGKKRVKLLKDSNLEAFEEDLRRATSAADRTHPSRSGYVLACKLIPSIFELEELAQSRGQGLRKKKEADLRPALDAVKIGNLKEYINLWCKKNNKDPLKEHDFNDAVSEKVSYARRKMKTFQK